MAGDGVYEKFITNIRGRNNVDDPFRLPEDRCVDCRNIDWFHSALGRRRGGTADALSAGATLTHNGRDLGWGGSFTLSDAGNLEAWVSKYDTVASAQKWFRYRDSVGWTTITDGFDTPSNTFYQQTMSAAVINGKLFMAYENDTNRLHCFDTGYSSTQLRRVGLPKPAAPTVADNGVGTYAATKRYYKVRWVRTISGKIISSGDMSPATAPFTPSGTGLQARITRPTLAGEHENFWQIYVSVDDAFYFLLTTVASGTSTYDDTSDPASQTGKTAPVAGSFTTPPNGKFLVADRSRLVIIGAQADAGTGTNRSPLELKKSRIWWTSPLNSTDEGDDERVSDSTSIKSYDDINGEPTAAIGPVNGVIYVWTAVNMYKMTSIASVTQPYIIQQVAGAVGCIDPRTACIGEDENGDVCVYWCSPDGPCRYGSKGFQRLWEDISDLWHPGYNGKPPQCAVFYRAKHQWWVFSKQTASAFPTLVLVFDTRLGKVISEESDSVRGGWSVFDGYIAKARHAFMFAKSFTGAAAVGTDLVPYILAPLSDGSLSNASTSDVVICDTTDDTDVGSHEFSAYLTTKMYAPWGYQYKGGLKNRPWLLGKSVTAPADAGAVTLSAIRDGSAKTVTSPVISFTKGADDGDYVARHFDNVEMSEAFGIQFKLSVGTDDVTNAHPFNWTGLQVDFLRGERI